VGPALRAGPTLVLVGDGEDVDTKSATSECIIVYWAQLDVPPGTISLPLMVDESALELRGEYVDWCSKLAMVRTGSESLAAALSSPLLAGGSFWWTSAIAARSPVSSASISEILRLRVLEKFYAAQGCAALEYIGTNRVIERILREWCASTGHLFVSRHDALAARKPRMPRPRGLKGAPHPVRAFAHFLYFVRRRCMPARSRRFARAQPLSDADLLIFTYFPNVNLTAAKEARFSSNYWGPLHGLVTSMRLKVNWVWFHHDSPQLSYRESAALRTKLNARSGETAERFFMLEEWLGARSLCSAVSAYLKLLKTSFALETCREHFAFSGGTLNFFPLLEDEWYSSLRGADAMSACLYAAAMHDMVSAMPAATSRLLYIWENQPWEQSLLCAWKSLREGTTLGVVHTPSCVAPMYLRTYLGREPTGDGAHRRIPDRLVAFGKPAAATLRDWGWPAGNVTAAEALRYMHLSKSFLAERRPLPESDRHLLVVIGIMRSEAEFQLKLLSAASERGGLNAYARVTVKAHPFCPVNDLVETLPFSPMLSIDDRSLDQIFSDADVVFASNSTSAAVEAAWVGLPLIITVALDGLNLNPLMGAPGIAFVATPDALESQLRNPTAPELPRDTYLLDEGLPHWRALLRIQHVRTRTLPVSNGPR
jgi:surface carbohydrate biosynthesis protein (TIGR04326 family)